MTQLTKFILGIILSLLVSSCAFDINLGEGERGNGNVISEDRNASESFTRISAQEGLDVYVTQGETASIQVEADENIMELIRTDIDNGRLRIHADKNIGRATKKVYVTLPVIEALEASSGADLITKNIIKTETIRLKSSSGADLIVKVSANEVDADSSSGADIRLSGEAKKLIAEASSGSDIKASDFNVEDCNASASSGSDILVSVSGKLIADASSGGDIRYRGEPKSISKNKSASGSVSKQ
ncbi:head GIN domain-containing protein [Spongiivirga citrea]|uniref:DUF2807 domain-containing protein n=1 Tax=Spongiivirga citrea TaxID=1481457 RepID=A0A6M0CIF8_9FLAO|nr:head GIN domain-containing protein [Spongiivirga citrea]NER15719.1 DUF2807 domain-containing protein [Spongiivirga citrea]